MKLPNCDSSTTFQTLTDPSRPPEVTHRSLTPASMPLILSWCPNKVSTYAISSRFQILTALSAEQLNRVCVFLRNASPEIESR